MSTIDLFDGRFTLLTGPAGSGWRPAVGIGEIPLTVLTVGRELTDLDGELARRYGLTGSAAALVRPDGYVAWVYDGEPDPARLRLLILPGRVVSRSAPYLVHSG